MDIKLDLSNAISLWRISHRGGHEPRTAMALAKAIYTQAPLPAIRSALAESFGAVTRAGYVEDLAEAKTATEKNVIREKILEHDRRSAHKIDAAIEIMREYVNEPTDPIGKMGKYLDLVK